MYGNQIKQTPYQDFTSIVGTVGQSPAGNTVLRVGRLPHGGDGYEVTEHIVLVPEEREALIADLIAQREDALPLVFTNVNEEGEQYGEADSLDVALLHLRAFPNDSIVVTVKP